MEFTMLNNLFTIINAAKKKVPLIKNVPTRLPEEMEKSLKKQLSTGKKSIDFYSGSAQLTKENRQTVFIPNQEFYIAAIVMPVVHTILSYINYLSEHTQIAATDRESYFKNLRDKPANYLDTDTHPDAHAAYEVVNNSSLTSEEQTNLKRFILNYDSWGGAKSVGRQDAYVSAIYQVTSAVQSTSSTYTVIQCYLQDLHSEHIALDMVDKYLDNQRATTTLEKIGDYNLIVAGAPGTGKSYSLNERIKAMVPDAKNREQLVFRQTLYPDYSYTDFIGQIMPVSHSNVISYQFVPAIFTNALRKAYQVHDDGKNVFLVLEELSRANAAAVFGDIFQLLDRKKGVSEYGINNNLIAENVYGVGHGDEKIYLPDNLYIWCTINTSDQNVFSMDTAFKRRFTWQYVSTKPSSAANNPTLNLPGMPSVTWTTLYQALNQVIIGDLHLGEDKQIGQFFAQFGQDEAANVQILRDKVVQYLWDDVNRASLEGRTIFQEKYITLDQLHSAFEDEKVFVDDVYTEVDKISSLEDTHSNHSNE
jgi:hypothetical protein